MTTDLTDLTDRELERYAATVQARWADGVQNIARRLRDLADDVERRVVPPTNIGTLHPDYLGTAERVLHDLSWGFANLNISGVVTRAADAQHAADAAADRASAPKVELDPDQQLAARAVAEYLDVQATLRSTDHEELHSIGKHGQEYKLRASDLRTLLDVFTNADGKA